MSLHNRYEVNLVTIKNRTTGAYTSVRLRTPCTQTAYVFLSPLDKTGGASSGDSVRIHSSLQDWKPLQILSIPQPAWEERPILPKTDEYDDPPPLSSIPGLQTQRGRLGGGEGVGAVIIWECSSLHLAWALSGAGLYEL